MKDLLGEYLVEISGAAPERCLNRLTGKDIPFRRLRRTDEFRLQIRLRIRDWDRAEREILAVSAPRRFWRSTALSGGSPCSGVDRF